MSLIPGLTEVFMLYETKTSLEEKKKKKDFMNLHSKASLKKTRAAEALKFICCTKKGSGSFHLNYFYVSVLDFFFF